MEVVRLTALSHGAGCACKLSPSELHPLLEELPAPDDPRVLVGSDTADDAAAFYLSPDLAILTTVDFFTPIVDDPYDFGRMAATGRVHPEHLVRNSTGRPGDDLYLTKPVGGGVISTAAKRGLASTELVAEAIAVMTTLNRDA